MIQSRIEEKKDVIPGIIDSPSEKKIVSSRTKKEKNHKKKAIFITFF